LAIETILKIKGSYPDLTEGEGRLYQTLWVLGPPKSSVAALRACAFECIYS
jgi:hypothetical protein